MNEPTIKLEMCEMDLRMQDALKLAMENPTTWNRNLAIYLIREMYKAGSKNLKLSDRTFLPSSIRTTDLTSVIIQLQREVNDADQRNIDVRDNVFFDTPGDPYKSGRTRAFFMGETVSAPIGKIHKTECSCEGCKQAKLDASRVHSLDAYLAEEKKAEKAAVVRSKTASYVVSLRHRRPTEVGAKKSPD